MANYQANLNEWVQVTTNTEDNTITAPPNPSPGHWFGVKFTNLTNFVGTQPFLTNVEASPGQTIEDTIGGGPQIATEISFNYESAYWVFMGSTWWLVGGFRHVVVPEMFDKAVGSTLIGTNTPIPLVYDPTFQLTGIYFQENAGNLECIRPFAGSIDVRVYFEYVLPGNNQDASGQVLLATIAGTPSYRQGAGAVGTMAHSRAGTFYLTIMNKILIVAKPGDIVGLVGNNDPTQSGDTYVVEDTGLIAWHV